MVLDKFRLIELVRQRPVIWDFKNYLKARNVKILDEVWAQIGKILGSDAYTCRSTWQRMRIQYCNEEKIIQTRIEKAKVKNIYQPRKKYYSWRYYDALRFISRGRRPPSNASSDSDIEIVADSDTDQTQMKIFSENNSFQTESDDDVEFVDCQSSDQTPTEKRKYFENSNESDNDFEIIENSNEAQSGFFEKVYFPSEAANIGQVIPIDDSEDDAMPEDPISKSSNVSVQDENEFETIANDNNSMLIDSIVKEEPELQIEPESNNYTQIEAVVEEEPELKIEPKSNNNTQIETIVDDSDDDSKLEDPTSKSSNVSVQGFAQEEHELETIANDNNSMLIDSIVKEEPEQQIKPESNNGAHIDAGMIEEEPELQIEPESNNATQIDSVAKKEPELLIELENVAIENEDMQIERENVAIVNEDIHDSQDITSLTVSASEQSNCSGNFNLQLDSLECEEPDQSNYSEEPTPSLPDTNDEDYCYLFSFLEQIKQMSDLQKTEFHANMKSLLLNIFPASASVNILEKQLLLPEDNDPDRKFLISFWPFIKSMPIMHNLEFRAKMAYLVLQIVSIDTDS